MPNLTLPERASSRDEARELTASLPASFANAVVTVDGHSLDWSSSSYVDELVKQILSNRNASKLILDQVSERVALFAKRSAERRGVFDRLTVKVRPLAS